MVPLLTRLAILALASRAAVAAEEAAPPPAYDPEHHCDPKDPCCIEQKGDKTCGTNTTSPGVACFSQCTTGKLYWRDWASIDDGLFVQFTRPLKDRVGPRRCAKIVITKAANVLGYIAKPDVDLPTTHEDEVGRCGDREQLSDDIFKDTSGVVAHPSWFNVTGVANSSFKFDLALLNDLDWKGTNLHMTLRPNQGGNFSGNYSYFEFEISSCNMTEFQTDRALWQTAMMDLSAALFSLFWVTASWAFCGGVRQWRGAREERRVTSMSGMGRRADQAQDRLCPCLRSGGNGLSEGMLDNLLEGSSTSLEGSSPGRQTLHGDAESDKLIARRRKQDAWRAEFMAKHRFTWPYYVWIEPDNTILKVAGQRAVQYMEFQWAIIRLLIGLSLPTLVLLVVNTRCGTWCQDPTTKQETTEIDQQWGIPLLDGSGGDSKTDYVCRMSSNNIDASSTNPSIRVAPWGCPEDQSMLLCVHLAVAIYFSVATYAVSKRDILGRPADKSRFLKVFEILFLNVLVPDSFWRGAHCKIRGASSYAQIMADEEEDDDDSAAQITVTVTELTGLSHPIELSPDATVEELKELVCADSVASPVRLQLVMVTELKPAGIVLDHEFLSLRSYGVADGSTLKAEPKAAPDTPGVTRPASPDEEPLFADLSVTRPASPDLSVTRPVSPKRPANADAELVSEAAAPLAPEHEAPPVDDLFALPPRPVDGVSRPASPSRGGRPLGLAETMHGGDDTTLWRSSTGTFQDVPSRRAETLLSGDPSPRPQSMTAAAAEPFGLSPMVARGAAVNLRQTGFEYAQSTGFSPESGQTSSSRYRCRDATVDRKKGVSPARHALVVRRISTKFEDMEKKGWLRNTLYRVFHRSDEWKVVDILVYRTSKHGLACFDCCECFKCHECTAFIVFESPQTPLDIILRHRDATQKAWLSILLSPLINTCGFCWFICAGCCPRLPCRRNRNSLSPRASEGGVAMPISTGIFGMETIFGRSPDTDKLAMRKWELQPGPTKEDLKGRADAKGRFKNLNRPRWQKTLTTLFGTSILLTLTSLVICSSTLMEAVVDGYNSATVGQQAQYDPTTGNLMWPEASPWANFFAKYIPTLVNFLVIVGVLPTLIDFVVYVIEPHYLMSDVYRSVLNKNLLLLLVSSLILPSLALTSLDELKTYLFTLENQALGLAETLITGRSQRDVCTLSHQDTPLPDLLSIPAFGVLYNFITYPVQILYNGFGSAFGGEAAGYFFRYMTHASLLGLGAQLLLMPDKFYKFISFIFRWKNERKIVWEFPLEYNYSIFCSTFAITMVYAIPHPPILFLGLFYAVFRAFGDKYALLFAHEGNLDSHFTDADEEGGADTLEGEGVQASASYHAKALNETVHNFLLLTIAIFQVAMYGFLRTDPNGSARNFDFAWLMLISFFVSLFVYLRRTCAIRRTRMDEAMPEARTSTDEAMPERPSGFGYYNDADAFDEASTMRLTTGGSDGFTFS